MCRTPHQQGVLEITEVVKISYPNHTIPIKGERRSLYKLDIVIALYFFYSMLVQVGGSE